jgi:hypothetical protein
MYRMQVARPCGLPKSARPQHSCHDVGATAGPSACRNTRSALELSRHARSPHRPPRRPHRPNRRGRGPARTRARQRPRGARGRRFPCGRDGALPGPDAGRPPDHLGCPLGPDDADRPDAPAARPAQGAPADRRRQPGHERRARSRAFRQPPAAAHGRGPHRRLRVLALDQPPAAQGSVSGAQPRAARRGAPLPAPGGGRLEPGRGVAPGLPARRPAPRPGRLSRARAHDQRRDRGDPSKEQRCWRE